jgi:uncharacterized protein DUF6542
MITTTERAAPAGASSIPRGAMRRRSSGPSITLTGRGGVVVIFAITLLGALLGAESLLDVSALPGVSFVIGCVLAAVATRRADLLTIAASPPLLFLVAMLVASTVGALGDSALLRSVFVGLVNALTNGAPWLFLGTLLVLAITIPRGLLTDLRELRTQLRAELRAELRPKPRSRSTAGRRTEDPDDDPVRWDEPH